MRYYLVQSASEVVPIVYDGQSPYTPPAGYTLMPEAEFEAWRVNNPAPEPVLPVPAEVGSGQIRAAMIELDYAADDAALNTLIEDAIVAAVPVGKERQKALTLWRNASTFKRSHPFIEVVKAVLSKSDADIDHLFRTASMF